MSQACEQRERSSQAPAFNARIHDFHDNDTYASSIHLLFRVHQCSPYGLLDSNHAFDFIESGFAYDL